MGRLKPPQLATADERSTLWPKLVELWPAWTTYQEWTPGTFGSSCSGRPDAASWGEPLDAREPHEQHVASPRAEPDGTRTFDLLSVPRTARTLPRKGGVCERPHVLVHPGGGSRRGRTRVGGHGDHGLPVEHR